MITKVFDKFVQVILKIKSKKKKMYVRLKNLKKQPKKVRMQKRIVRLKTRKGGLRKS